MIIFSNFQLLNFFGGASFLTLDINLNVWFICEGQFFPVVLVYLLLFFKFSSVIEKPALKKLRFLGSTLFLKKGNPNWQKLEIRNNNTGSHSEVT